MFSTFCSNLKNGDLELLRSAENDNGRSQHSACERCRSKKLRCSGQSGGCNRCKTSNGICIYAVAGSDKRSSRARHQSNGSKSKSLEASETPPGHHKTSDQPTDAGNDILSSSQSYMTEDNNDQTDDTGLDDDMLPFGEEFNLSEQNFSEFVSDQVNPVIESDFRMKDFAASKDNGAESRFSESGILGKVVTFPDDDAVNFDFLSDTLVATPPVLFDRPSMARTPFPREKPQLEYNLASPQLPLGMITPTATHDSISSVSYQSQDRPASDGAAPRNEGQSCRCMQKGVILLEEVENQTQNFDPTAIDSALAYHKGALETCFSMLRCYKCAVCIEIAMLLTLVANKLSQLCEKIVSQLSWSSESEDGSRTDAPHRNVFLGNYEINSLMEWIQLMKGLITVQLKGLIDLAARMKGREPGLSGLQLTKLGNVEREVRKILGRLQGCEVRL